MFSNFISTKCRLISNQIFLNRLISSFDSNLIKCRINSNRSTRSTVLNVRQFCQKIDKQNNFLKQLKDKSIEQQKDRPIDIIAKKIPKRSEFFYLILKKPNELIEWIAKTPPEKKKNVILSGLMKYLLYPSGVISLLFLCYYLTHSDENPITGRTCVYSLSKELIDELENDLLKQLFDKNIKSNTFLPATDPAVKRLDTCFNRLIESNKDLEVIGESIWGTVLISDDNICDVIILKESQNVFVYKKMLDLCQSEDELAYVLAHQLSHMMLDHRREPISYTSPIYIPLLTFLPQLWGIQKDPSFRFEIFEKIDTFLENIIKYLVKKALTFTAYSEELEEEADRIAMQLMTRACFDIRKCRQFCLKHRHLSPEFETESQTENKNKTETTDEMNYEFFRKHPITSNKLLYLFQYIKPYLELRKICACNPIPD